MAVLTHEYTPVSEDEYLRLEAQSPIKHEYVNGELFAMTGGTLPHNVIAGNMLVAPGWSPAAALRVSHKATPTGPQRSATKQRR